MRYVEYVFPDSVNRTFRAMTMLFDRFSLNESNLIRRKQIDLDEHVEIV